MMRLAFVLGLVPALAWAQKPTVIISGDGAATVVSVGTQGPPGANIPAGGSEGLVPAKSGSGFAWSDITSITGRWSFASYPTLGVYLPNQTSFAGSFILGTGGAALTHGAGTEGQNGLFVGLGAGDANTTGDWNTFIGYQAGRLVTTAAQNTFVGAVAGWKTTTGSGGNTFVGAFAGQENTTGYWNTFLGTDSGIANTTGYENMFLGSNIGASNTTGYSNTYVGARYTGAQNITGCCNTAIGEYALNVPTASSKNIAIGFAAGRFETGSNKLFIDSFSRGNEAEGRSLSLIYGVMGAAPKNQTVTLNAFLSLAGIAFADLGTPANGTFAYCADCTVANPCAGSGTGALAKRLAGAWVCN